MPDASINEKQTIMRIGDLRANNDECSNRIYSFLKDDNEVKIAYHEYDVDGNCDIKSGLFEISDKNFSKLSGVNRYRTGKKVGYHNFK